MRKDKIEGWSVFIGAIYNPVFVFFCGGKNKPINHMIVAELKRMGQKICYTKGVLSTSLPTKRKNSV